MTGSDLPHFISLSPDPHNNLLCKPMVDCYLGKQAPTGFLSLQSHYDTRPIRSPSVDQLQKVMGSEQKNVCTRGMV